MVNETPTPSDQKGFCVWVSGEPASVADSIARALTLELTGGDGTVVLGADRASDVARAEVWNGQPRVVEVVVGEVAGGAAPAVVVSGDGARAGESARVVLRYLAATAYTEQLDEYSDDDEAAVSGRLQAFGYL